MSTGGASRSAKPEPQSAGAARAALARVHYVPPPVAGRDHGTRSGAEPTEPERRSEVACGHDDHIRRKFRAKWLYFRHAVPAVVRRDGAPDQGQLLGRRQGREPRQPIWPLRSAGHARQRRRHALHAQAVAQRGCLGRRPTGGGRLGRDGRGPMAGRRDQHLLSARRAAEAKLGRG